MGYPLATNPPDFEPVRITEIDALARLGGEPLIGSGFETEQPDLSFDERI